MMDKETSEIVFYAFRYCLGRMTYCVSDFCKYATRHMQEIDTHELQLMAKEIREKANQDVENPLNIGGVHTSHLGWDCDKRDWLTLLGNINAELTRREVTP